MDINSKLQQLQEATFDGKDAGEGLAVFFTQDSSCVCRYRFLVKAITSQGVYDVGEFYSSPPAATTRHGRLTRMIAAAVCPGVQGWAVQVSAVPDSEGLIPEEVAEIILASSKCCTAPVGVTRVGERYRYAAGAGTTTFRVAPGQRVTGIGATGLAGDGTITVAGGNTIVVPAGIGVSLEPNASIAPNSAIVLTNVDWLIEYLESA